MHTNTVTHNFNNNSIFSLILHASLNSNVIQNFDSHFLKILHMKFGFDGFKHILFNWYKINITNTTL